MLYGQERLEEILADETSDEEFLKIRKGLLDGGRQFFDETWEAHQLDEICLSTIVMQGFQPLPRIGIAVPMGYRESGEPVGLTIIVRGFQIPLAFQIAYAIGALQPARRPCGISVITHWESFRAPSIPKVAAIRHYRSWTVRPGRPRRRSHPDHRRVLGGHHIELLIVLPRPDKIRGCEGLGA